MREDHFSGSQLFVCAYDGVQLQMSSLRYQKHLESEWVYVPQLPLCHIDMFKIISCKKVHFLFPTFYQVVLITMVQRNHYVAREL